MEDTIGAEVRAVPDAPDADFERWMLGSRHRLLRTAFLLTGDHHAAEDLLAATLAKVYLAWHRVDPARADAYTRRALVNEHASWWRRAWRRREVVTDAPPDRGAADPAYDGSGDVLWDAVLALPRRQRAVLVLRYYEELTEAETADLLGISVGTVKSQCSRALATLRDRMPEEER